MNKQCAGSSLIFWLPVLCLALGPTASAVDDEAPALETPALESPAAPPSDAASLTGVSASDTEIVVQAGSEEFHVPVQVGG